ncbi:MAG: hypothetical protein GOP50_05480 [Candidatus Heimdallarchaeota archaeon]|nr:hypothetical protein [Candidatus Heimdallarchaeota archaeon]
MPFFVITGRKGEGKSFLAEKLSKQLIIEGYEVRGIITRGQEEKIFVNIDTNEEEILWKEGDILEEEIGDFKFSKRALAFARKTISEIESADIVIIDEIAWLESEKRGLYEGINQFLKKEKKLKEMNVIFVVRHQIVEKMNELFEIEISKIWYLKRTEFDKILNEIIEESHR